MSWHAKAAGRGAPRSYGTAANTAPAMEPADSTGQRVQNVVVDGLVVLKIVKHCQENFPVAVAGSLLGWGSKETSALDVTYSFPFPKDDMRGDDKYEEDTLKALKEVHIDVNVVGWYQSTYLGSYFTRDTIMHQLEYQENDANSVVLIYDGVKTAHGALSLKALRLTDSFCQAWRERKPGADPLNHFSSSEIFEEVPLKIRNPHLIQAFLLDLTSRYTISSTSRSVPASGGAPATNVLPGAAAQAATEEADVDFARLDLNSAPYLEKHLEFLSDTITNLLRANIESAFTAKKADVMRRQRDEWIARRRQENEERRAAGLEALPEEDLSLPFFRNAPDSKGKDPVEMLLMSAQISNYCSQVTKYSGTSFGKLFLAGSLHK